MDKNFSRNDIKRGIKIPKEITTDLAYLCGILAGDGHISKDRYTFECGGNPKDEKEFYDFIIKKLMKSIFNVNIVTKEFSGGTYGFRYESKAITYFLTDTIGLPRVKKYEKLRIPVIFASNKELVLNFVRGLFDTDFGFCLCKKYKEKPYYPQICFDSKSEKFCKEIWQALKDLGVNFGSNVYLVYDKDERAKEGFTITYRFDMYGHKYFINILKVIDLRHPKHFKKYKEWVSANKNNPKLKKYLAEAGFEPATYTPKIKN